MSSPLINRWGLNTFWHNFWYSDFRMSYQHKQDTIFENLINVFLFYGVNLTYNLFANTYWYSHCFKQLMVKPYFRIVTRKPNQFGEILTYRLRKEQDCVFPMKIWIIKYSGWVLINQYWFYPIKKQGKIIHDQSSYVETVTFTPRSSSLRYRKLKTLLSTRFIYQVFKSYYYCF